MQDDPEWHLADTEENEDCGHGDKYEFGQECLDRVAINMGGNTIVPVAGQVGLGLGLQSRVGAWGRGQGKGAVVWHGTALCSEARVTL